MIDFSKVPFPDAPVGVTVSGKFVDLPEELPPGRIIAGPLADDAGAIVDLNLDGAKRALAIFNDQVAEMEAQAQAIAVKDPDTAADATEMTGQVKRLAKQIDERRKEIVAEPDSFVRKVNSFCKPVADRLKALEALLQRKLSDYAYQQELARREMERLQREAQAKLQAELDREAAAKNVAPVQVAPVALPAKAAPTRSDGAVASAVMVWKHEVLNPDEVPREYLVVNEAAIREAVKAGIRAIPGVRIFEDAEIRTRIIGK